MALPAPVGTTAGTTGDAARPTGYGSTWGAGSGVAGDVAIIQIISFSFAQAAAPSYAGFTLIRSAVFSSSDVRCDIHARTAGGSESSTYARSVSTTYSHWCFAVPGAIMPTASEGHSSANTGTGATITGSAVSASAAGALLLFGAVPTDDPPTSSGMTRLADAVDGTVVFYQTGIGSGSTGTRTTNTESGGDPWAGAMLVLDEAPSDTPLISSSTPSNGATGVSRTSDVAVTYDENVSAGSGNFELWNVTRCVLFESIPVGDGRVSISSATVTINPTGTFEYGAEYALRYPAGIVVATDDSSPVAAVANDTTLRFRVVEAAMGQSGGLAVGTGRIGLAKVGAVAWPVLEGVDSTDASTGVTDHTIGGNLTIGSESNRKVVIPYGWFGASAGVTAATFNGTSMSGQTALRTATIGSLGGVGFLYLDEASLPAAGSYAWSVTVDGASGVVLGDAIYLYNVKSGAPEATGGNDNTSTSISATITTTSHNALIIDALINQSGTDDGTPDAGQSELADFTGGTGVPRLCVSFKYGAEPGSKSTGWSALDNVSGHILVNAAFAVFSASSAASLDAAAGALVISGGAATVRHGWAIAAAAGALTLSGGASSLVHGRPMVAAAGALALTGGAATLTRGRPMVAAPGALTISGGAVALVRGRPMVAAPGALALTGGAAVLAWGHKVSAAPGALTLTGGAATFVRGHPMVAAPGALTLAGGSAALVRGRPMVSAAGALALTGGAATFVHGRPMVAGTGALTLTGGAASFNYSGSVRTLNAETGVLTLTGGAAGLAHGWRIAAASGSLSLTGGAATLTRGRPIVAGAGSLTLSGGAATLTRGHPLVASPGALDLIEGTATLLRGHPMAAAGGALTLTGGAATLTHGRPMVAASATLTLSGGTAGLIYSGSQATLVAAPGALTLTGGTAALRAAHRLSAAPGVLTLAGGAATLTRGRQITAAPGALTLTGGAATLQRSVSLPASPAALILAGGEATLTYSGANKVLSAAPGALTLAAATTSLRKASLISGAPAALTLVPGSAALHRAVTLAAAAAALLLVGGEATFSRTNRLAAGTGTLTLVAPSATLTAAKTIKVITNSTQQEATHSVAVEMVSYTASVEEEGA